MFEPHGIFWLPWCVETEDRPFIYETRDPKCFTSPQQARLHPAMDRSRGVPHQVAPLHLLVVLGVWFMSLGASAKPNILVMMTDDTSYTEYGFGGKKDISTPTLDDLAKEGVSFKVAYSNPMCQPTRAMLMTGEYATTTGWWDQGETPTELGRKFGTFGHAAQDAGYRTLMVGKYQLRLGGAKSHGFNSYCLWKHSDIMDQDPLVRKWVAEYGGEPIDPRDRWKSANRFWKPLVVRNFGKDVHQIVNVTNPLSFGPQIFLDCIRDFIEESDKPFFIYFPAVTGHVDFDPVVGQQAFIPMPIVNDKLEIVGREPDGTGTLKANVEWIDIMVKKLQAILKDTGVKDNTVVFFTSDNASQGGGKGQVRSHNGIHVPLVVWGGPVVSRPPSCELVSLVDIYATVAAWTGGRQIAGNGLNTVRKRKNSISLVPFLKGAKSSTGRKVSVGYRTKKGIVLRAKGFLLDGSKQLWDCRSCGDECKLIKTPRQQKPKLFAKFLAKRKKFLKSNLDVTSF